MKLISLVTLIVTILTVNISFGQDTELEVREKARNATEAQLLTETSMYTQDQFLYFAEILTDRLLTFNSQSPNYNYRKGFLVLKIRKDYMVAMRHLEIAITDISANYDMYSIKEKSAPADAYFHLATCYHLNEEIDKAEEYYNKFLETSKSKSELLPVARLRIIQCGVARELMAKPTNVLLKNVGSAVNTEFPEYSPVVSLDGSALYFTSRRPWRNDETEGFRDISINQYPEDVYVSYLDFDTSWTEPTRLKFCLPKRHEATSAVSSDERRIYLYEDSTGFGDIYSSDFYLAKFQEIEKLDIKGVNTNAWETHAMMAHDQQALYFVSDREGGYGGRDIYMLKRQNNSWSEPINLGPGINGPYDEDSPFISIDNKTLYFATNGPKSIGGFDIMYSEIAEDGTWPESENLGYPFNSTNDDIFYTTTIDGLKGYMTSFRKDGFGEKDIYEIHNDYLGVEDIAVLKGQIKTVNDKPIPEDFAINVKLTCIDCDEPNSEYTIYPRLRDGVFMTALLPCRTYTLTYVNLTDNKILGSDGFTTECITEYQEIYKELILDVDKRELIIPEDTIVPVTNPNFEPLEFIHYFSYNKNVLNTSEEDLNAFIAKVEEQFNNGRKDITITIYSSASYVPTTTYRTNKNLAHVRAENMQTELMNYVQSSDLLKGKVKIAIGSELVQGPAYERDAANKDKYNPYQYVGLKTN